MLNFLKSKLPAPLAAQVDQAVSGSGPGEVAKVLGISLSAVKMRIKRAREDFRSRYLNMQTIVLEAGRR